MTLSDKFVLIRSFVEYYPEEDVIKEEFQKRIWKKYEEEQHEEEKKFQEWIESFK